MDALGAIAELEDRKSGLGAAFEEITPEYARRLLARNKVNRRMDDKVSARYARDMRAGEWRVTGEAICIDANGDLRQGQHRLKACVAAGVPFFTLVVRGIEPESQLAMDSGKKRSLNDQLALLGEKNASDLATVIGLCWAYDRDVLPHRSLTPSRSEALAWLRENEEVRNSVAIGKRVGTSLPIARTVASVGHFLIWRVDEAAANGFFERLVKGANLQEGDPILAFRRWLDRWAGKRDKPSNIVHLHALLKCSNFWRAGNPLKFVKVLAGESFPRVWGEE